MESDPRVDGVLLLQATSSYALEMHALLKRLLPELESSDDSVCLSYAPEVRELLAKLDPYPPGAQK